MSKDFKTVIGDNIKYFRTSKGLTQKELAGKIDGLSEKALAAYEQHVNIPDIETIFNISEQLDIPYTVLIGEEEKVNAPQLDLSPDELKLLVKYRSLPDKKKLSLLEILDISN